MWTVREAWTKFTFPVIMSEDNVSLDELADKYLHRKWTENEALSANALWEECSYTDKELSNFIPSVKLTVAVNQRRLKFNPEVLAALGVFQPVTDIHDGPGFRFSSIDLHLFFNGIAILVIEICPCNTTAIPIGWIEDVNSTIASVGRGVRIVKSDDLSAQSTGGIDESIDGLVEEDVGDSSHACSLTSMSIGSPFCLSDFISEILLEPCRMEGDDSGYQAVVDTFLPAFGALLLDLDDDAGELTGKDLADEFERFAAEHLTVLRKTLPSHSANVLAHTMFGDPEHNYMPYHNVIHSQSLEGGFVLAFDNGSPHYHSSPAPAMESFRTHYFNIVLIAFHQRLSILKYTMMAAKASMAGERYQKLRDLREQIYEFTSRCYFTQVSMSEERDQLYRRWQRAFHVLEMYDELKEEVSEIQDYLADIIRTQDNEHQQWRTRNENSRTLVFMYISVLFLPITVVLDLITASPVWTPWLNFRVHPIRAWTLISAALLTTVIVLLEAVRMWRRWGGSGNRRR